MVLLQRQLLQGSGSVLLQEVLMNKSDTARMSQSQHEEVIELIEIVREDENLEADSDLGQPADIIELNDAIDDSVLQAASPVCSFARGKAGGQCAEESDAAEVVERPSDIAVPDLQAKERGAVAAASDTPDTAADKSTGDAEGLASETVAMTAGVLTVAPQTSPAAEADTTLMERLCALEERLARISVENDALRLRVETLEQRLAAGLERSGQALALIEERTAALEAVPQISLDSIQAAMDSLSSQLNASLETMQSHLDAMQDSLYTETALATLATRLEPTIDKAAAQAAARVIREEITRLMTQA